MRLSLSVSDLQVHREFLLNAHLADITENRLETAIYNYETYFFPKLVTSEFGLVIPNIDIAWVWHCHRLSPKHYANYCRTTFGKIPKSTFNYSVTVEFRQKCMPENWSSKIEYDLKLACERQKSFLWQILPEKYTQNEVLESCIQQYTQFLELMAKNGYKNNFYVPNYPIDFAWHTHILMNTEVYFQETKALVGEIVNHDDSVNERSAESKLTVSWENTKELWKKQFGGSHGGIVAKQDTKIKILSGSDYRGEPPSWFFETQIERIIKISENSISEKEIMDLLEKLDLESAEKILSSSPQVQTEIELVDKVKDLFADFGCELTTKVIPARICNHSVPMHKDKYNGVGAIVEDWVYLLYLKANGKLVLKDELTGGLHEVLVKDGTMIAFPNSRFSHSYDADLENGELRVMLGPVTFDPVSKVVTMSGGCGGCGGGGCGGGGCGGGDGGCGGCGGGGGGGGSGSGESCCSCRGQSGKWLIIIAVFALFFHYITIFSRSPYPWYGDSDIGEAMKATGKFHLYFTCTILPVVTFCCLVVAVLGLIYIHVLIFFDELKAEAR